MSQSQNDKWDLRFLNLAKEVATWSKDPKTQVGCVIVDPDTLRITGIGFNGFPRGMCDHEELYADRDIKLKRVLHGEENAILNSQKTEGCTAYVTHPPCAHCALHLIQSGIERVVCFSPSNEMTSKWGADWVLARGFFEEVEIKYEEVDGQRD